MLWKIASLSVNTSSMASTLEVPAMYSGKLKGLWPKVISLGVEPVPPIHDVLCDNSTQGFLASPMYVAGDAQKLTDIAQ